MIFFWVFPSPAGVQAYCFSAVVVVVFVAVAIAPAIVVSVPVVINAGWRPPFGRR